HGDHPDLPSIPTRRSSDLKTEAGAYTPTSIVATGHRQTGTAAPTSPTAFKFRIDVDTGSGFQNGTPDSSAVSSKTYSSFPANLKDRKSTRLNSSHVKISYA